MITLPNGGNDNIVWYLTKNISSIRGDGHSTTSHGSSFFGLHPVRGYALMMTMSAY